jgi:two-component system chemotaxis response regulator CheY
MEMTVRENSPVQKKSAGRDQSKNINVLVVDDSPLMRKMIIRALSGLVGIAFAEAENGLNALERMNQFVPNLVILDCNMPQMDGLGYLRKIRMQEKYNQTPVIMLTTETNETQIANTYLVGTTVYLTKPFSPDMLVKTMRKLIHWKE